MAFGTRAPRAQSWPCQKQPWTKIARRLPGKPDIVLPRRRLAVFVHGCFWHGHDCARGARVPKANRDYWLGKVGRNRERDIASTAALGAAGWRVETVWECELKDAAALEARARGWLADRG